MGAAGCSIRLWLKITPRVKLAPNLQESTPNRPFNKEASEALHASQGLHRTLADVEHRSKVVMACLQVHRH